MPHLRVRRLKQSSDCITLAIFEDIDMKIERSKCAQTNWAGLRDDMKARQRSNHVKRVGYMIRDHKAGGAVRKPVTADMVAMYTS